MQKQMRPSARIMALFCLLVWTPVSQYYASEEYNSTFNDYFHVMTLQVSGTCRSLSLSSDLKSLSVITEVRSADNNPEICYIQVRWMIWLHLPVLLDLRCLSFFANVIAHLCLPVRHRVVIRLSVWGNQDGTQVHPHLHPAAVPAPLTHMHVWSLGGHPHADGSQTH